MHKFLIALVAFAFLPGTQALACTSADRALLDMEISEPAKDCHIRELKIDGRILRFAHMSYGKGTGKDCSVECTYKHYCGFIDEKKVIAYASAGVWTSSPAFQKFMKSKAARSGDFRFCFENAQTDSLGPVQVQAPMPSAGTLNGQMPPPGAVKEQIPMNTQTPGP